MHMSRMEERKREWLKTRPYCNICNETIEDERCYVVEDGPDEFEYCICKKCLTEQLRIMKQSKVSAYLREALAEYLEYNCERITPTREV